MKRFLMLVGVAAVAAAMYVAASPASQQATGPVTAKQFKALKAQVAALSKKLKTTKSEADASVGFLAACFLSTNAGVWGVDEFGDPNGVTEGYVYQPPGVVPTVKTTALDFTNTTNPTAWFQAVDPTCVNTALRHRLKPGSTTRLPLTGERSH